jgi:hypothetical protein
VRTGKTAGSKRELKTTESTTNKDHRTRPELAVKLLHVLREALGEGLILPAEEVFHLAAVLGVVEDVADRGGMQRSGVLTCEDPFAAKGEKFEV